VPRVLRRRQPAGARFLDVPPVDRRARGSWVRVAGGAGRAAARQRQLEDEARDEDGVVRELRDITKNKKDHDDHEAFSGFVMIVVIFLFRDSSSVGG
jgi:hypothetical protein